MSAISPSFFKRGTDFLGCDVPFLCGGMTWVSDPALVAAVCNAGGFAALACGNAPVDIVEKQIAEIRALTSRPFAVNLITLSPLFRDQLAAVCRCKVSHVVLAGGLPRPDSIATAKTAGVKVMCFAAAESIAKMMIRNGADALIIEGMESGGHIGLVSTTILVQEVLFAYGDSIPIFVAGGIATGQLCAHLFMMGAAGIQFGTMFAVSEESRAHPNFKKAYLEAAGRDAVATPILDARFIVPSVRALKNKGLEEFARLQLDLIPRLNDGTIGKIDAAHHLENFWVGALRRAVLEGDTDHGSMMAGQSVGLINSVQPVKTILETLARDTESELRRVGELISLAEAQRHKD